eukprot:TRINITY_DN10058_c0_g1_i3.p1 TRINITY_DN10058_c0_g1~~TRINITY_DN10058_c0_g1_i3.p1  ORF type:complete len:352 (-),score=81.09 TRINITY_DN10058_c0_g1_i3:66-1121(-)
MRRFTREEVERLSVTAADKKNPNARHQSLVILDKLVLDVTDFAFDHPGGHELIHKFAGKDISHIFRSDKYHVHSKLSSVIVKSLQVGVIADDADDTDQPTARSSPKKVDGGEEEYTTDAPFLDLDKPLVPQLLNSKISKDEYMKLVHRPRHHHKEAIIFPWPFLEQFTHTHWMTIPIVWGSIGVLCAALSLPTMSVLQFIQYWCTGLFLWTLVEYLVHRFVFHAEKYVPDHPAWLTLHFLGHAIHHFLPMEKSRLVMPLPLSGTLGTLLWFGVARTLFDLAGAQAAFCGGIFGYICYDLGHYFMHHAVPSQQYLKDLKSYHVAHHYVDPNLGFGVSSKLWDLVFGTILRTN